MRNPQHVRIGACRAAPTLVNGVPMIVSAVSRQTSVGPNTLASSLYFWFESACALPGLMLAYHRWYLLLPTLDQML